MKLKVPIPIDPALSPRPNHGRPWPEPHRVILKRMFAEQACLLQIAVVLGRSVEGVTEQLVRDRLMWRDIHKGAYDCYWRNAPEAAESASDRGERIFKDYYLTLENEGALHSLLQRGGGILSFDAAVRRQINTIRSTAGCAAEALPDRAEIAQMVLRLWSTWGGAEQPFDAHYNQLCKEAERFSNAEQEVKEFCDDVKELCKSVDQLTNQEETTMSQVNTSLPVVTKTYVFGQDTADMDAQSLINSIKRLEKEVADLEGVKTPSKKIAAMIESLNKSKDAIVALLDALPA